MEPAVNINDICRICGTHTSGMVRHFIFEEGEAQQNLPMKISSCLPILISEEDFLPKFVCGECVYKLDILYDFRTISVKTDQYLKKLLQNQECESIKEIKTHLESSFTHDRDLKDCKSSNNIPITESICKEIERVTDNPTVCDLFMSTKKSQHLKHTEIDISMCSKTLEGEANASEQDLTQHQIRKRPIRAVRLNSEISYSSDSLLESLLKKSSSRNRRIKGEATSKQKKTLLRQCKYCKIVLPSPEYYNHLNEEHKKQYECNVCKNRYPCAQELEEHRELTDHVFSDTDEDHFKGTSRVLKCSQCQKTYMRKHLLVLHMRRHTGERPFPCHLCERKYACKSSLNSHLLKHKEEWKHVCNFCGKGFVDKHSFIYHVRSNHTGERPFACEKCDRKFIKKQDLLKHEQTQHSEMPKELFACEECGRVCKDYDALRSHRRSHIPVEVRRVHKCTLCEASFTGKTGLMKHMHRHTGEMPYECEQCTKRFFTKKGLELHLVIHSGVKSFICEYCGRAFSQDNTLRVHRRTHTGERPYECNICLKRFTQSSALNSHRKLHLKDN